MHGEYLRGRSGLLYHRAFVLRRTHGRLFRKIEDRLFRLKIIGSLLLGLQPHIESSLGIESSRCDEPFPDLERGRRERFLDLEKSELKYNHIGN